MIKVIISAFQFLPQIENLFHFAYLGFFLKLIYKLVKYFVLFVSFLLHILRCWTHHWRKQWVNHSIENQIQVKYLPSHAKYIQYKFHPSSDFVFQGATSFVNDYKSNHDWQAIKIPTNFRLNNDSIFIHLMICFFIE